MSWFEKLYQTYENNTANIGDTNEEQPLEPICHVTQNAAHITIVVSVKGEFITARTVPKLPKSEAKTLIPVTEKSAGRAGDSPVCHPLCDKLQYVAGDLVEFGGEVTSGFASDPHEPYRSYVEQLSEWCSSPYQHHKVSAILCYVRKKTVVADLVKKGILHVDTGNDAKGKLLNKWPSKDNIPDIFKLLPGGTDNKGNKKPWQTEAFVRWSVESVGDTKPDIWKDESVWQSWADYYRDTKSSEGSKGLCYVTGEEQFMAIQHPKKIHNGAVNAKLISSNDKIGYTFRGRFISADQACGIGFEATQKAHNALRWLIARQGWQKAEQAIVSWAVSGIKIPNPVRSTDFLFSEVAITPATTATGDTAQDIGNRLSTMIAGYKKNLGNTTQVVVMGLDSASDGCMAITYYSELTGSDFLKQLHNWHEGCSWLQRFDKDTTFVGAPAPSDIAETAFAVGADGKMQAKLRKTTVKRLLPCIVDGAPLPFDLVESCVRRASCRRGNRYGNSESEQEYWRWEKNIGIACSLFRYFHKERSYQMALERERKSRDYLYGRLLALAERLEEKALYVGKEKRETNAGKLMQRFTDHPYSTWLTIETSLTPYKVRLRTKRPYFLWVLEQELDGVFNSFIHDDFTSNNRLTGEFLLGYHCQRSALPLKKEDQEKIDSEDKDAVE